MPAPKDFSLILPTRGRRELLQRFIDSLALRTHHPDRLEIILRTDEGDRGAAEIDPRGFDVTILTGPRVTMGSMLREGYAAARGDYLFLMNDDVIMRTDYWDDAAMEAALRFDDGVALIYGNDLQEAAMMATFPLLPRTTCELLGGICPEAYVGNDIDVHILDVFTRLALRGHHRIVFMPDVVYEHVHFNSGKARVDATYRDRIVSSDRGKTFARLAARREEIASAMNAFIETAAGAGADG
jgi:hypothetical protein